MRRNMFYTALAAFVFAATLVPGRAESMSVGFYGSAGGGGADWQDRGEVRDDRIDTRHVGYGFVLDTWTPRSALAYRLSIGYERIDHESAFGIPGYILRGGVVDQDLAIDIIRPAPLRIWVGPELRLAGLRGKPDGAPGTTDNFAAIGIGPVMGVDYDISPSLALSWKLGYLVTGYATNHSEMHREGDTSIGEGHAFLTLSFLFRIWGGAPPGPPPPSEPQQPYYPYPYPRY